VPAVCRGNSVDSDVAHCSTPLRDQCSSDVFVDGTGVSRQGDNNTSHLLPPVPCPSHAAPIAVGSTTVFINGKGCGRIGDAIAGCTSVATGFNEVFAGG
jgi:uncharacterized Zn-binding protein involved in type VI secretion|tara:strand:+ start:3088 stop:3384 length:297 start_codon:yes stop_codon:yes gene_type:complete